MLKLNEKKVDEDGETKNMEPGDTFYINGSVEATVNKDRTFSIDESKCYYDEDGILRQDNN